MNPEVYKERCINYAAILRKSIKTAALFSSDLERARATKLDYLDDEGQVIFTVDNQMVEMLKGAACGAFGELARAGLKMTAERIVTETFKDVKRYIEKRNSP